jgi:alpha-glucosidase (family GH31 glycosyl hydrolase)
MIERNKLFNKYEFPVDVLWLDIYHTQEFQYFEWDRYWFPTFKVDEMNEAIYQDNRTLVVITDPHIKVDSDY